MRDRLLWRCPRQGSAHRMPLLPIEVVCFQEFGPEILWRRGNVWPTVRRKVHEIPVRPHRVNVISLEFSSPEMKYSSTALHEHMHHGPLHVVRVSLTFVVGLIGGMESGNQRDL